MLDEVSREMASKLLRVQGAFNLSKAEVLIILQIINAGTVTQNEIKAKAYASFLTINQALKNLVDKEILRSNLDKQDRRQKIYALAPSFAETYFL